MNNRHWASRSLAGMLAASMLLPNGSWMVLPLAANEGESTAASRTQASSLPQIVPVSIYDGSERSADFNQGWKFTLSDAAGAQNQTFDDSKWENLSLPHDYSIDQEYSTSNEGESGFLPGGIGWYRKTFSLDESVQGKNVRIDFDGVYMNSDVYINGHHLGNHPYGYTPFSYDLSPYLNYEGDNVISVRVNHQIPSSRWYSGSGIYRDVKLTITDPVHVGLFGTHISADNLEAQQGGAVDTAVSVTVDNDSSQDRDLVLDTIIYPAGGDESQAIGHTSTPFAAAAGTSVKVDAVLQADNPELWSTDNPALYIVKNTVMDGDEVVDTYTDEFGYRYFSFDPDTGFSLNGVNMKLNGVCLHHDQGSLGSEANYRATERQVEIMKEMGANAIRTSHNTASRAMIEACQRKGMLLIEEFFDGWSEKNGNSEDYTHYMHSEVPADNEMLGVREGDIWARVDLRQTIARDVNSPSIIMWSTGNELEHGSTIGFADFMQNLINWIQEEDTSRPITLGDNKMQGDSSTGRALRSLLANNGGVLGSNYANVNTINNNYHKPNPTWKFYGSENVSATNSRGVYDRIRNGTTSDADGQVTSYDYSCVSWGNVASDSMYQMIQNDFMAGQFVWTGFDYIGEPTPWNGISPGPTNGTNSPKNSYFGIVDTAGFAKDTYYFYASQWKKDQTTLHVLPAWNEEVVYKDANGNVPVVVYSNAASVELFLQREGESEPVSMGKKTFSEKATPAGYTYQIYEGSDKSSIAHRNLYLTWNVPYADGTLYAVARDKDGNIIEETVGRNSVTTAGEAARLSASADRTEIDADGYDLSYITVDVTDADGNMVPDALNRVTFDVEGEGELLAVDNGWQTDYQSYSDNNRRAYNGKVLAIVRSTRNAGDITVTASAEGLESAQVVLHTNPVEQSSASDVESFEMSKTYYVKAGTRPQLPETLKAALTDGSIIDAPVIWDTVSDDQIAQTGSFVVHGICHNTPVSVSVHVIESVAAMLNYSVSTPVGLPVVLPDSRPAVMADGTVLPTSFDVVWDAVDASIYDQPGLYTISGTADVLGDAMPVSAVIRVQERVGVLQNSITHEAREVTQDIPAADQSDTLAAIYDGSTTLSTGQTPNPTMWSNYTASSKGDTDAEITVAFDTQKLLGEIVMHFADDAWCVSYPEAGSTVISISEDGEVWQTLEAQETIGTAANRVTPYTYTFEPTRATFVRFHLENPDKNVTAGFTCVGMTELEIKPIVYDTVIGSEAGLESLKVNGVPVSASDLASGSTSTPAPKASIEAVGKDNASVTVLPAVDGIIRILTESEDHSQSSEFIVRLNAPYVPDAADDSLDVDPSTMSASASSEYLPGSSSEGPVRYVLDGNANTWYHTNWNTSEGTKVENRHVDLELSEPTELDALRYLPRTGSSSGGMNGFVTSYSIQYRESDEDTEWKEIASGSWVREAGWKQAIFDHPVTAKHIRFVGVHTWAADGTDAHMSAAELRVRQPYPASDLAELATLQIEIPERIHVDQISAEHPAEIDEQIVVKDGDTLLVYGQDYYITYTGNDKAGTATALITGIGKYKGSVERTFIIEADQSEDTAALRTALQAAVDAQEALSLKAEDYTESSWTAYAQALQAANDLLKNSEADAVSLQNALDALNASAAALEKAVQSADKTLLRQAVSYASALLEDAQALEHVNALVRTEFEAALQNAQAVLADDAAGQETVDAAWSRLAKACHMLGFTSDKAALSALVEECEALDLDSYADGEAKDAFLAALEAAKAVLENPATLDETSIIPAYEALLAAKADLAPVEQEIDLSLLQMLYDFVKDTDLDKYVSEGKDAFTQALSQASSVLASPETQNQVDEAVRALSDAYLNLRLKADESLLAALQNFTARAQSIERSWFSTGQLSVIDQLSERTSALLAGDEVSLDEAEQLAGEITPVLEMMDQVEAAHGKPSAADSSTSGLKGQVISADSLLPASSTTKPATAAASHAAGFGISAIAAAAAAWLLRRRSRR